MLWKSMETYVMSMDCYGELQKARGEYWVLQNRTIQPGYQNYFNYIVLHSWVIFSWCCMTCYSTVRYLYHVSKFPSVNLYLFQTVICQFLLCAPSVFKVQLGPFFCLIWMWVQPWLITNFGNTGRDRQKTHHNSFDNSATVNHKKKPG